MWGLYSHSREYRKIFLRDHFPHISQILEGLHFCANACRACIPEGPKIQKIQDFAPGLKPSSDQSQIEIFNRDWTFQSRLKIRLSLWGLSRSGLKFSSEIENFNRDWKFQSWIENFNRMDWKLHAINRDWIFSIAGPSGIRTHANTGKYSWRIIYVLVSCQGVHRPAPVQNFSLPKKMGATEERFRWWIWFSWFSQGILYPPLIWKVFQLRPEKFPKRFSFGGGRVRLYLLCKANSPSFSAELPRGPNDQKNRISLEIFNLDRNFWSRSKMSISTSRIPHKSRAAVGASLENFILTRNPVLPFLGF